MVKFLVEVAVAAANSVLCDVVIYIWGRIKKWPPRTLKRRMLLIVTLFLIFIAVLVGSDYTPWRLGETVAVAIIGPPEPEKDVATLWSDYKQGRWSEVVTDAERIVKMFRKVGGDMERELETRKASDPPKGRASS